jgi:hypothetical protein
MLSRQPNTEDLKKCFETFEKFIQNPRKIKCRRNPKSKVFKYVKLIAEIIILALEKILSTNIVTCIFSAVLKIISILLRDDMFNDLVEYIISVDLLKAVNTLQRSLKYLVGVLNDILQNANNLSERKEIADDIESNFNIHTGCNEIEPLKAEIERMSSSKYLDDSVMEKVEWYCFVSLLRELDLLLLLEIYKKSEKKSTGISDVLENQKTADGKILSFLFKPKRETLKLFLKYRSEMRWPLVDSFLENRGLIVDEVKDDLVDCVYEIVSVKDPNIKLSLQHWLFFFCMRANKTSSGDKTHFKLEKPRNGVFQIRCMKYENRLISKHAWTRADLDTPGCNKSNVDWTLVKIIETGAQNSESSCFVIVAKSSKVGCLYYDCTGRVHDKAYDPSDGRCLWTLRKTKKMSVHTQTEFACEL